MGINHTNLYKIFMESKDKAEENIYSIILDENLNFFTKDDIISLCNEESYKNLLETKILVHYVDIIYDRFTKEEYLNLFLNAASLLQQEIFYYLIKIYDKELLIKIKETNKYNHLFNKYSSDIIVEMIKNKDNIWNLLDEKMIIEFINNHIKEMLNKYIVEFVRQIKNNQRCVIEIFNNIYNIKNFIDVLKELSSIENYQILLEKYEENIILALLKMPKEEFERFKYKDVVTQIIKEVLEMSNTKIEDIEVLKEGATSTPYIIGSLVLKVGKKRYSHQIPNHSRILKPLFRKQIEDICIEITNLVDTNNITDDDVYVVFKELMDNDIVWIDARKENLGRLLKDNNSYGINVNEESIGFKGKNKAELKKGELVILDTDLIFSKRNIPWSYLEKNVYLTIYHKMMDRYLKEKIETKHR